MERSANDRNASNAVKSCYGNMVVYQRDFDQFNFGEGKELQPGMSIEKDSKGD
jgi:hypothetical protein